MRVVRVETVAKYHLLQIAMRGKKRKGADEPKHPKPKVPKPKAKGEPDNLGWVGPVSPQGKALKARLKEQANSRLHFVKCYLKGFIRWKHRARLPAKGKEYPALGFKKLRDRAPKSLAQQPVPKPKSKGKPDNLGWVGPVSPQGKELKARLKEQANSRLQFVKCYLKGFIRDTFFFGNAGIATRGGWRAKAVLQVCREVVERANSGKPIDRVPGKVVTMDEFCTSRVSSAMNSTSPATPGDLGKWVDRDCNAALNIQRAGESKWRPLELCRWKHRARLPAKGKEYPALGFKKLQDRAPKDLAQQPVAQ
ncbi:hypothetical protein QJQ45_023629 [Haematococcus lacustris]|nr:hypothetical protein QJQ45_023629 [Haematococcus lacustris]